MLLFIENFSLQSLLQTSYVFSPNLWTLLWQSIVFMRESDVIRCSPVKFLLVPLSASHPYTVVFYEKHLLSYRRWVLKWLSRKPLLFVCSVVLCLGWTATHTHTARHWPGPPADTANVKTLEAPFLTAVIIHVEAVTARFMENWNAVLVFGVYAWKKLGKFSCYLGCDYVSVRMGEVKDRPMNFYWILQFWLKFL